MVLKLKFIREKQDLTQQEMADKLGISKTSYNYFETGERIIPLVHLNKLCNIFHVSSDYVLGLTNCNIISKITINLDKKLIGERIKKIRLNNNLTQEELAVIFHTSQSTISSYEKGRTLILTAFLYELCTKLNVNCDYIIGRSNIIKE